MGEDAKKALGQGRLVARVGAFTALCSKDNDGGFRILLRKRTEKTSIIYGLDLSGRYELPGGAIPANTDFFSDNVYSPLALTLQKELKEETGICIDIPEQPLNCRAVFVKESTLQKGISDVALVSAIHTDPDGYPEDYQKKLDRKDLVWITQDDIENFKEKTVEGKPTYVNEDIGIEITSFRMLELIKNGFALLK